MDRAFKYEVPGVIFYVFLLTPFLFSEMGKTLLDSMNGPQENAFLFPLLTLGAVLLTSKGIGFIFVSIVYAVFNMLGGYSQWFKDSVPNMKHIEPSNEYTLETMFVYRFWSKKVKKDDLLDAWVTRRWTLYFTNWASVISILLATTISFVTICLNKYQISCCFLVIWSLVNILILVAFWINRRCAKKETLQILDMLLEEHLKKR